jgi:hypothetical protein
MTDDTKREPVRWDWNTILNAKEAEKLGRDRITISVPVKDILYGTPLPSADTKREPVADLVARLEHQARCEITPRKSNLLSEAADTIARLEQELARPQKRDGNFLDHMGCCRVCGGEIPYGHTDYCDIWKLRQRAEAAERRVRELTDHACSENMAVVNKQIALQAAEAERDTYAEFYRRFLSLQTGDAAKIAEEAMAAIKLRVALGNLIMSAESRHNLSEALLLAKDALGGRYGQ